MKCVLLLLALAGVALAYPKPIDDVFSDALGDHYADASYQEDLAGEESLKAGYEAAAADAFAAEFEYLDKLERQRRDTLDRLEFLVREARSSGRGGQRGNDGKGGNDRKRPSEGPHPQEPPRKIPKPNPTPYRPPSPPPTPPRNG